MGFDSLWLPESHFQSLGSCPAPLLLLAAAAARTSRIGLGTTSYLLPIRNALHAAEEVAVLDRLSNGRVILGLGRGFRPALFAAFEVQQSEKRDRFESCWRSCAGRGPASRSSRTATSGFVSSRDRCRSRIRRCGSPHSDRRAWRRPAGSAFPTWPRRSSRCFA